MKEFEKKIFVLMKLKAEDEETDECNMTQKSTTFCFLFVYGLHENIWS